MQSWVKIMEKLVKVTKYSQIQGKIMGLFAKYVSFWERYGDFDQNKKKNVKKYIVEDKITRNLVNI